MTTEERVQKIHEEIEGINQRVAEMRAEMEELRKESEERWKQFDARVADMPAETEEWRKQSDEMREGIDKNLTAHTLMMNEINKELGIEPETPTEVSIRRILDEHFDADYIEPYVKRNLRLDGWGVARNGTGAAYLVKIESRYVPEHLDQVWQLVWMFRSFWPEFESNAVYPILAVAEIDDDQRELVWQSGIHLIDVSDGVLEWTRPPKGFRPCGDYGASDAATSATGYR